MLGETKGEGPAEAWHVSCSFCLRGEDHQGPALVCRARHGMVWDGMVTVGPGLKKPCDVKRVGSDIMSTRPK